MNLSRRSLLGFLALLPVSWVGGWALRRVRRRQPFLLRPPGAGPDEQFLSACIRCQQCVEACPAQCLVPAGRAKGWFNLATPQIVARETPCDLCAGRDRLECIAVCPTRALQPVAKRSMVQMGVAVIDPETCLPFLGVACKACWHACPFPNDAIRFNERGRPIVVDDACVGCGLCEHVCLAEQSAIVVRPSSEVGRSSGSRSRAE